MRGRSGAAMFCCRNQLWIAVFGVVAIISSSVVTAVVAPASNCYAFGNENQLYDLTALYGHEFETVMGAKTYTLRLCKSFQQRSQDSGYVSFGSYEAGSAFHSTTKGTTFIQDYKHGDLSGCEHHGTEFNGRFAEVSVVCGNKCPNGVTCTDSSGCICSVTMDVDAKPCVASVVLAIPCPQAGPRAISGFSVGFSPRGQEVVANGLTQWGFDSDEHTDYSFDTSQSSVFFYFSAPSEVAKQVEIPKLTVSPSYGLELQLAGTAASAVVPTTLAPSILEIVWRCETADTYLVNVTIPVKGYDPIVFTVHKLCASMQTKEANASSGWATFGVLSCIFFLVTTMCCCGGFFYRTQVENKHGLEAVPGIGVLSSCLDAASRRDTGGYRRADEGSSIIGGQYRDVSSSTPRAGQRNSDGRYGSV